MRIIVRGKGQGVIVRSTYLPLLHRVLQGAAQRICKRHGGRFSSPGVERISSLQGDVNCGGCHGDARVHL